jgi:hypothetical protein
VIEDAIRKYKIKGIVVDTNLVLVLILGKYNPARIATFKNTSTYTAEDYILLTRFLRHFERRIALPNILTEVDNLSRQIDQREHVAISEALLHWQIGLDEIYLKSSLVIGSELHQKIGLTDSLIIALSEEFLVLTADFPLASRLASMKRDVINFNNLRFGAVLVP